MNQGVTFSPNAKVSHDFTKKIAGGLEYYAAYASPSDFAPLRDQLQRFFPAIPAIDIDSLQNGSLTFGVGMGTTHFTDHLVVKCIIGRRFSWTHGKK